MAGTNPTTGRSTPLTRLALSTLWALLVCYPDPRVLWAAIRNTITPPIDAAAVADWARTLPDQPAEIERLVLERVKYAVPWESAGVPWVFAAPAETLARGMGDCQARAVVLASVLAAKGIPFQLRASLDHMWVEYPGKRPNELENAAKTLWDKPPGAGFRFRLPSIDWGESYRIEKEYFWGPAPVSRRVLLFAGWLVIWFWRAPVSRVRRTPAAAPSTVQLTRATLDRRPV